MKIDIIRSNVHDVNKWAGGTTTQLLIYPENSHYQNRDFLWRISSASVEADESVFTSLPGISRILMVIEGELRIEHEGEHTVILKQFEQDSFMGDWNTKSFGRATDFNLMMAKGCRGSVDAVLIDGEGFEDSSITVEKENYTYISKVFYAINGDFKLKIDGENCTINFHDRDVVALTHKLCEDQPKISIGNTKKSVGKIIKSVVYY